MCVRNVDDQGVLQFTLILAAGCVLHRRTSRVIHRQELCHNSWKSCVFHPVPNTKKTWVRKKKRGAPAEPVARGGQVSPPPALDRTFRCKPSGGIPSTGAARRLPCRVWWVSFRPPSLGPGARPGHGTSGTRGRTPGRPARMAFSPSSRVPPCTVFCSARTRLAPGQAWRVVGLLLGNDPSAGSPTETLLRLLLPLNDQV